MSEREGVSASYCCARNCKNRRNTSNLFFFQLPGDRERAKIWLSACGRRDLIGQLGNLDGLRLCAAHFDDSMFETVLRDRLIVNAVPIALQGGGSEEGHVSEATEAASESSEALTHIDIKLEDKLSLDLPTVPANASSVETPSAAEEGNTSKVTHNEQNLDIFSVIGQNVRDVRIDQLKSSEPLTELNIKREEDDMEVNVADSVDDEFKEVDQEVAKVSNAHIDMFFESLLGVAKTLNRNNQMILADKLKEIVNEYR